MTTAVIELSLLDAHPRNPRIAPRQDVVDAIASQIKATSEFDPVHAILVRPMNGRYQIVHGHHRVDAARQAGLSQVPCWVREMTDDESYMQLALGNAQGELDPIEIGIHALGLEDGQGGRGLRGGLSEYARQIGKHRPNIVAYRNAAEVLPRLNLSIDRQVFLGKALHLAQIHRAPEEFWACLVDLMIGCGLSAADVEAHVDVAVYIAEQVPPPWRDFLKTERFIVRLVSPETIGRMIALADAIVAMIESYDVDRDSFRQAFYDWLPTLVGDASDVRRLVEYQRRLQQDLAEAEREPARIALADYRDWLPHQPLCDLLLTDPPYMTDVDDIESFAAEWLPMALGKVKETGRAYIFIGAYPQELRAYLNVAPPEWLVLADVLVWTYRNTLGPSSKLDYNLNWQAVLYYRSKYAAPPLNCPVKTEQFAVQEMIVGKHYHTWQKPDRLAEQFIMHSTEVGALVLDPFAGTGTFLLAACRLGRRALGCEIAEEMIKIAQDRGCVTD